MSSEVRARNHQVPKGILKRWCANQGEKSGIYFYNIIEQTKGFAPGRAASFAIADYLYVPELEDLCRDDGLEVAFSKGESDLARLIDGTIDESKRNLSPDVCKNAIRACVALGYRSSYYSSRAAMLNAGVEKTVRQCHREVIEITRRTIFDRQRVLENWSYCIISNLDDDLLISERPFIDLPTQKFPSDRVFMALHPRILLCGCPSSDGKFSIRWMDSKETDVRTDIYNGYILETARCFVVSNNERQLDSVIPHLSEDKVIERAGRDTILIGRRRREKFDGKWLKFFLIGTTSLTNLYN